jgi:hypothetical protein
MNRRLCLNIACSVPLLSSRRLATQLYMAASLPALFEAEFREYS